MLTLNQTPRERIVDSRGQPYFIWDQLMSLDEFEAGLRDPDPDVRVRFMARVMRDARPDDSLQFVTPEEMATAWDRLAPLLGRKRDFWAWLLDEWDLLPSDSIAG